MQTLTSRDVQVRYGEFVDAVLDDAVCVTRHGRPLYWAMPERLMRETDLNKLFARIVLWRGQQDRLKNGEPKVGLAEAMAKYDSHINHEDTLTEEDVLAIVKANRI